MGGAHAHKKKSKGVKKANAFSLDSSETGMGYIEIIASLFGAFMLLIVGHGRDYGRR